MTTKANARGKRLGMTTRQALVLFSGGIGSFAAGMRTAFKYGAENTRLLFTDTKTEDEDLYRFINQAAEAVGSELIVLTEGRDVWELFFDQKFIGNTRVDICSRILKRDLARDWINENCDPADTAIVLGIDWTEIHRYERAIPHWKPYTLNAPMVESPLMSKDEMIQWARDLGIEPPRLYAMGFPHNNCGGFCVKQGHKAFENLLRTMPDRYAYHEAKEQEFRDTFDKDVAILRDRRDGSTTPYTLKQLRERLDTGQLTLSEDQDWGGCGCMVDWEDTE